MKPEVGKKYQTDDHRFAWVEIVSQDDHPEQPFYGITDHGLKCYFTREGECLGLTTYPIFVLTKEYAV